MPRSANPRDYSTYMLTILYNLAEERPSSRPFALPNKIVANRLRREFYSLKRALIIATDKLSSKGNLSDGEARLLTDYTSALDAFSLYQIAVSEDPLSSTGEVILTFQSRDETDLMQIFAAAIEKSVSVHNRGITEDDLKELERLTGKPAPAVTPLHKPSPSPSPIQEPSPEPSNAVEQRYEEIMENHKAAAKAQRANLLSNTPTEEENKVGNPYY